MDTVEISLNEYARALGFGVQYEMAMAGIDEREMRFLRRSLKRVNLT